MSINNELLELKQRVIERSPAEKEFHQSVETIFDTLEPVIKKLLTIHEPSFWSVL